VVDLVVSGLPLDAVIFRVFSNLNDSVILSWFRRGSWRRPAHPGLGVTATCSESHRVGSAGRWPGAQICCSGWGVRPTYLAIGCPPGSKYRTALGKHQTSMEQPRDCRLAWWCVLQNGFPKLISSWSCQKGGRESPYRFPHTISFLFSWIREQHQ